MSVLYEYGVLSLVHRIFQVMLGGAWMKELVERVGNLNDESVLNLTKETLHKQMNITASPVFTKVHYQMVCQFSVVEIESFQHYLLCFVKKIKSSPGLKCK